MIWFHFMFYLLDKKKKVLQIDAGWRQVVRFFEK